MEAVEYILSGIIVIGTLWIIVDTSTIFTEQKTNLEELTQSINSVSKQFEESDLLLMNPTITQVESFLRKDNIDKNNYSSVKYDCTQFSIDTVKNAIESGLYACLVDITSENKTKKRSGHAIIAFNTSDFGIIYVEPQNDGMVNLNLGVNYHCLNYNDCEENESKIIGWYSCFGGEVVNETIV